MTWLWISVAILTVQLLEYLYLTSSYGLDEDLTPAAADAGLETVDLMLALLVLVAFIGSAITFIKWMRRAHANLPALGFAPRFGDAQPIWTWFVPILNLWRPKQIANDIWRSGQLDAPSRNASIADLPTPGWLLAWWLLLLFPVGGVTNDSLLSWVLFAGTLLPSGLLAIRFIREATDRQRDRDALLSRDEHPTPGSLTPVTPASAPSPSGPFV